MRALLPQSDGESGMPRLGEVPDPSPAADEVVLRVRASGLNHADLLQLKGLHPPPPGEPEGPGLECAGEILELGRGAAPGRAVGDRVAALTGGGAHAELVAVPTGQLLPLPDGWSYEEGAALPESALTAWTNLVAEGGLQAGESVLVSGATGAVGSFACQLARELDAEVIATGRDETRLEALAERGIERRLVESPELPRRVEELTGGRGVDLVIDLVGGTATNERLHCLGNRGRLVLVGLMGGSRAGLDLARILRRRLRITGSTLRSRTRREKAQLVAAFTRFAASRLANGRLDPPAFEALPATEVERAWRRYAAGGGKIVLTW